MLFYTAKIKAYESNDSHPGKSDMVYTCPERHAFPKLRTSRKVVEASWPAGRVVEFFSTNTPWDGDRPGDHDLSVANWISMINSGKFSRIQFLISPCP